MNKLNNQVEKVISFITHIIILALIIIVLIGMGELVVNIVTGPIRIGTTDSISDMIKDVATFFILLEIVLMLLKYMKDIHHVPVKYLLIISITAIAREMLLVHGDASRMLLLSLSILVLIFVLYLLNRLHIFDDDDVPYL